MKTVASILLLASTSCEAFAPSSASTTIISPSYSSTSSTAGTALDAHVNTRRRIESQELGIWPQSCRDPSTGNYVPCDSICGHDVRNSWTTYAPPHGSPPTYGAVGCPGGGDWCYASGYGGARALPPTDDARKRAATVAAALSGLGKGTGGARELAGSTIPRLSSGGISMAGLMLAAAAGGGGGGSVMGEDVRDSRGSYAPFTHDGRVGKTGEIGASGGGGGGEQPAGMALPPSFSFASSSTPATRKSSGGNRPKKYGLGSWKK
jgi:hypothetical protein